MQIHSRVRQAQQDSRTGGSQRAPGSPLKEPLLSVSVPSAPAAGHPDDEGATDDDEDSYHTPW